MRTTRHLLIAVVTTAALTLAGCGNDEDTDPDATPDTATSSATPTTDESVEEPGEEPAPEPAGPVVEITIDGDSVLPIAEQVEMSVDDTLTLMIDADRSGELHVHSTPEQTVEFSPASNKYEVLFDKPGTVDIEEHDTGVLLVRALVS